MSQIPLLRSSKDDIHSFILNNIPTHPSDIARLTSTTFGISRVSAVNHLQRLIKDGLVEANGRTKGRTYNLRKIVDASMTVRITATTAEDREWRDNVAPLVANLSKNVVDVCRHGFTEMFNNVLDHSNATTAQIGVTRDALTTELTVMDFGVGIFNKLQQHFHLDDPRHAVLELCKGKLTTDPTSHTGEGIFFTSRMFDIYSIVSGKLIFLRSRQYGRDWLDEVEEQTDTSQEGTWVRMTIRNDSPVTPLEVFERFAPGSDDYGFTRTVVPVHLVRYEGEVLVSRSQARRLMARVDKFVEVVLDFAEVNEIGPAFADEIFRVYQNEHLQVNIYSVNFSEEIRRMIDRAKAGGVTGE